MLFKRLLDAIERVTKQRIEEFSLQIEHF